MNDSDRNRTDRLLKIGGIGAVVTLICCFTPVLVVLFTALGLAAMIAWLDIILFPLLAIFLVLIGWSLWKRQKPRLS